MPAEKRQQSEAKARREEEKKEGKKANAEGPPHTQSANKATRHKRRTTAVEESEAKPGWRVSARQPPTEGLDASLAGTALDINVNSNIIEYRTGLVRVGYPKTSLQSVVSLNGEVVCQSKASLFRANENHLFTITEGATRYDAQLKVKVSFGAIRKVCLIISDRVVYAATAKGFDLVEDSTS